jgi:ankyrin repeat protein
MARETTHATEPTEEQQEEIIQCCIDGDVPQLRRWARCGVRVVFSAEPLYNAAGFGKLAAVRFLVKEAGADIQATHAGLATLLCVAALQGHVAVVRCLVKEFGADVNQATKEGGCTPVFLAAQEGHVAIVRCLVKEFGADVNQAANDGCTPLYVAAQFGSLPVVQCLVKELGADVNQARFNWSTPLMIASYCKHKEVVLWLIKHGADAQASTSLAGSTAADILRAIGAPAEQTAYLEARTHCANPRLRRCRAQEVRRLPEGVLLWTRVHSGALTGAQGRVQAVGR